MNAPATRLASIRSAEILVLDHAVLMLSAESSATRQCVFVLLASLEIHSPSVNPYEKLSLSKLGLVCRHLAVPMLSAESKTALVLAPVCLNMLEIHTKDADLSASSIQIAHQTELAKQVNVRILVQEPADRMLSARWSTINHNVLVSLVTLEIHSDTAILIHLNVSLKIIINK
jgi:hypothetical protein